MGGGGFGGGYSVTGYTHSATNKKELDASSISSSGVNIGCGGVSGVDSCLLLTFPTPLNSVSPIELPSISVGDVLDVALKNGIVVVLSNNGNPLGSITATQLPTLINCMNDGHQYEACVQSVNGGSCLVVIRHRK